LVIERILAWCSLRSCGVIIDHPGVYRMPERPPMWPGPPRGALAPGPGPGPGWAQTLPTAAAMAATAMMERIEFMGVPFTGVEPTLKIGRARGVHLMCLNAADHHGPVLRKRKTPR
jgi:hypothetical protein